MNISFTIPHRKLRAAALFASTDVTRLVLNGIHVEQPSPGKILLVATDGRRLCVIRHEPASPVPAFSDFIIPLSMVAASDHTKQIRQLNELIEETDWAGDYAPESSEVTVSFDDETNIVSIASEDRVTVSANAIKWDRQKPSNFWRNAIPSRTLKSEATTLPLGCYYVQQIAEAAQIMDDGRGGALLITGYGTHDKCPNAPAVVAFRQTASPDFFALLMPVKTKPEEIADVPDWLY